MVSTQPFDAYRNFSITDKNDLLENILLEQVIDQMQLL